MKQTNFNCIWFLLLTLFTTTEGSAQQSNIPHVSNPPINIEALFSNRGMTYQMIIDKRFRTNTKFGFFAVTNLVGEWRNNAVSDHMTQANLTYEITKGLQLSGGFHITTVTGIRPSAGLIYSMHSKDWLLVTNARVDLAQDANIEGLAIVEYKPLINDKWKFYSRLQGLYAQTPSIGQHARSYIMARAGFSIKEFTFGIGTNIDYYGSIKHNENSVGAFISCLLF